MDEKVPLYEEIANEIMINVEKGVYRPGDKIPSIRKLSRIKKVSINTVKEAYFLLEDRRVIDVRPQSGYFIKHQWPSPPVQMKYAHNEISPIEATTSDLFKMAHDDLENKKLIQLGVIEINCSIPPVKKLNSLMSSQIRKYENISVTQIMVKGLDRLRKQISRLYSEIGCDFGPDDVHITSGCMEGLVLSLISVCRPGDTVAVEMPYFPCALQIAEQLGYKLVGIPSHPETGISVETLEYVFTNNKISACLFVPNFNNPLGSLMPGDKKKQLVELASRFDIPVIEDDIYGDLSFSERRPDTLKNYDKTGNVILCSSFTKTLSPGYRVGWIVPGKYAEQIERFKLVVHNAAATPVQLVLAEFLENGGYDRYLRKIRKVYSANMEEMAGAIGKYFPEGTRVTHPKGGFILWVEMPEKVDSVRLYELALKNGVTIMPGPIFSTSDKFRNCIRVNSSCWTPKTEGAIKVLGNLAKGLVKG